MEAIDVVPDIPADASEIDTTPVEDDTSEDITGDNANTDLPSDVETPAQETVESVENIVTEPVQSVNEEVSLAPETEQTESDKISLKDKLVGYYQDLEASFSSFMSFLK